MKNKEFPNGFTSWMETHHEVVSEINSLIWADTFDQDSDGIIEERFREQGIGGMYELAEELTDAFEKQFEGVVWGEELEYFDTIETFLYERL